MTTATFSVLAVDRETDLFGCSPTVLIPYSQRAYKAALSSGEEG